jgi:hypothetical protein
LYEHVKYVTLFCFGHIIQLYTTTLHRPGSSIGSQFVPVLRGYITNEYQEGQIIRSEISSPVVFSEDLAGLEQHSVWNLTYNPGTGGFAITRI